ncbi:SRPBCC family protein [Alteraurantiacibacter aquimixticola]|uniref:ATPase n=1 Tax=Alteraurantiacibacter aquimixticola TaxID=2489173 RepID=A0A4T3F370_9SPHN|nr:SRPBCC family protein [Alteraurantiacibacter aquimixticola]TIX50570.1 ATPase [Alteraurantiacibacter aquimixticola]
MEINFRVSGRIDKPVEEVFEAVADPAKLSCYFTTGGAKGRMETGATVMWDFHDFPGAFPVEVVEVIPNKKIVLQWDAYEGESGEIGAKMSGADYKTTVTILFTPTDDGRTLVQIVEEGWKETPGGLRGSYGNCEGWTGMLLAMKAWLEHGINLREGLYK